MAAADNVILA